MKEITVPASIGEIDTVTDFVNAELEALSCPMRARIQLDIAIDELFGNIARYAYPDGGGQATVRVEKIGEPRAVALTFIDSGVPFDPLGRDDPDISLSAEERGVGGLGIFVVKKFMDDVSYQYRGGQNVLRIEKRLDR